MSRPVFCLDITSFESTDDRDRFLAWACRKLPAATGSGGSETPQCGGAETAASAMQSASGGIELVGAWAEAQGTRALTLYACHDGWAGGWRQMLELYVGVPDSLFLSAIDDLRYQATTLALLGVPENVSVADIAAGKIAGDHGVFELITVESGAEPVRLQGIRTSAETGPLQKYRLAGAFEVGYRDLTVAALWITEESVDLEHWRGLRGNVADSTELIGLRAYPGPALSAPAVGRAAAGR